MERLDLKNVFMQFHNFENRERIEGIPALFLQRLCVSIDQALLMSHSTNVPLLAAFPTGLHGTFLGEKKGRKRAALYRLLPARLHEVSRENG